MVGGKFVPPTAWQTSVKVRDFAGGAISSLASEISLSYLASLLISRRSFHLSISVDGHSLIGLYQKLPKEKKLWKGLFMVFGRLYSGLF